jgi:hypothetical protein
MLNIPIRASAMVPLAATVLLTSPTFSSQNSNLEAYELQASNFATSKVDFILIKVGVRAKADNRAQRLRQFLKSQGSPMTNSADKLVNIADKYGLDWKLLPAIAGVESTWGSFVPAGSYNAYGWHNGNFYFSSWSSASDNVASGILAKWGSVGQITPWKIGPYYAENPDWASRVDYYMRAIGDFK